MADNNAQDTEGELGRRIAAFRALSGMSLRSLAAASGVSSSFLSQLENGRTSASIGSLRKISAALGVSPAKLLDDSADHTRGVLKAADRPTLPLEPGSQKYVLALPPLRNLEVYAGVLGPGSSTSAENYTHGNAQEIFIVTEGEVIFELGGERYPMSTDDSIEFLSSVPHRALNESAHEAKVLWIGSPPTPDPVEA